MVISVVQNGVSREHLDDKLCFSGSRLIIEILIAFGTVEVDLTFHAERIRKGIIPGIQIQPCAVIVCGVDAEFLVRIEPHFHIGEDFLPDIAVDFHIPANGDVSAL